MNRNDDSHATPNLYLSAFLYVMGYKLLGVEWGGAPQRGGRGRALFTFEHVPSSVVASFLNGQNDQVSAQAFTTAIIELKRRMFAAAEGVRDG